MKNGTYTFTQVGNIPRLRERVGIMYYVNGDGSCTLIAHNKLSTIARDARMIVDRLVAKGKDEGSIYTLVLPTDISLIQLYMLIHIAGYLTGYVKDTEEID